MSAARAARSRASPHRSGRKNGAQNTETSAKWHAPGPAVPAVPCRRRFGRAERGHPCHARRGHATCTTQHRRKASDEWRRPRNGPRERGERLVRSLDQRLPMSASGKEFLLKACAQAHPAGAARPHHPERTSATRWEERRRARSERVVSEEARHERRP
ncbi:hypothetical protein SGPA1_21311 [Streptomyces misionensis JCM 4497]